MRFTKPKKAIGIDIGTHSVKAVQMVRSGKGYRVERVGYALVDRHQVNVDPILAHADSVRQALDDMAVNQSLLVGALPGQTVVIRYPRIPNMDESQIMGAVEKEAGQNIPYDLSEVYLDWSILEQIEEAGQDQLKLILVAAKHEVIESRLQIAEAAEIQYGILGVDSLALADAAECCGMLRGDETVALIHIGASSVSIHFARDGVSNFIRDISWGARELIQAIAKSRRCELDEAERALAESVHEDYASSQEIAEMESPAEAVEVGLDDPFGSGGGGLLDPLEDELGSLDGSSARGGASSAPASGRKVGKEGALKDVLSIPISRLVSEIRRSFDYYEHQLYENPVDRVVLSGGGAQHPLIRAMISEELGVDSVEIADPSASTLTLAAGNASSALYNQPSQFMVAIGLAARGVDEL